MRAATSSGESFMVEEMLNTSQRVLTKSLASQFKCKFNLLGSSPKTAIARLVPRHRLNPTPQLQCCRVRFGISGLMRTKTSPSGRYMSGDPSGPIELGDTGGSRILFILT